MKSKLLWQCTLFAFLLVLTTLPAFASQFFDNFSNSQSNWVPEQGGWNFTNPASGVYFYQCDCPSNSTTWRTNTPIGINWQFQADIYFRTLYGNGGTTSGGVCVNDRDAWTAGTFAGDWAREVLTLPGIDPKHWTTLWTTADSIYTNAGTNGYYGGSWSGPAEGSGSAWWVIGSLPEQITTSSSSANMIVAAAALESQYTNIIIPRLQISPPFGASITVTTFGQPYWQYQFQSSTNLIIWNVVTNFYPDPASNSFNFNSPINGSQMFFRAVPLVQP
jgi:hypothetical protein